MKGRIIRDEEGRFVVVYHKECMEESDAVIVVSCRIMPGFDTVLKSGDTIEFELGDFPLDDGGFTTLAYPIIRINPHDALADCIFQINYCSKIYKKLKDGSR